MSDKISERFRSSQGRGRNTQSEPHLHEKIDLTLMMRETSQRRRGFHSRNEPKDLEVTAELLAIDRALEEALRGYSKILTETNLVQIIKEYLSNDKSAGIRYDIRSLQRILDGRQARGFTRMMIKKSLRGKWRQLEGQQGSPVGTPETSDDDYDDEDIRENHNYEKIVKVDGNIIIDVTKTPKS